MACWNVIEHQELSSGASSVSFTGISASYDHLVLLSSARSDEATINGYMNFQVNGDTGTNYSRRSLNANTSTIGTSSAVNQSVFIYQYVPALNSLADTFGVMETWFIDYSNTSNYTQILSQSVGPNNSATDSQWGLRLSSGIWTSTAAINRVDVLCDSGSDDFVQYSTFTLYGINGAG